MKAFIFLFSILFLFSCRSTENTNGKSYTFDINGKTITYKDSTINEYIVTALWEGKAYPLHYWYEMPEMIYSEPYGCTAGSFDDELEATGKNFQWKYLAAKCSGRSYQIWRIKGYKSPDSWIRGDIDFTGQRKVQHEPPTYSIKTITHYSQNTNNNE